MGSALEGKNLLSSCIFPLKCRPHFGRFFFVQGSNQEVKEVIPLLYNIVEDRVVPIDVKKVNGYSFKGSESAIFVLPSFLKIFTLEEKNLLPRSKFFPFKSRIHLGKGFYCQRKQPGSRNSCSPFVNCQKNIGVYQ